MPEDIAPRQRARRWAVERFSNGEFKAHGAVPPQVSDGMRFEFLGGNSNDTPITLNLGIIDSRLWSILRDLPPEKLNAVQRDSALLGRAIIEEIILQ